MKIAVASDHAGFEFKEKIKVILEGAGHAVTDVGTNSKESCDYPEFAVKAANLVVAGTADRAILICWTGNGMAMAANKVKGIRAGLALNPEMAYLSRWHNDANVLALSQKYTPESDLKATIEKFLNTGFEGGRHTRRLAKMMAAEKQ